MSLSLPLTVLIEAIVVSGFARWRKKPAGSLLAASLLANLLTQTLLWGLLNLFYADYLAILFAAEIFIWLLESIILRYFPGTWLTWREAGALSLGMNLASLGIGWFLPV